MNALPSPEYNKKAVWAAIHSSAGTLGTCVGHWRRRPPGYLAIFSTFARFRPKRMTVPLERADAHIEAPREARLPNGSMLLECGHGEGHAALKVCGILDITRSTRTARCTRSVAWSQSHT